VPQEDENARKLRVRALDVGKKALRGWLYEIERRLKECMRTTDLRIVIDMSRNIIKNRFAKALLKQMRKQMEMRMMMPTVMRMMMPTGMERRTRLVRLEPAAVSAAAAAAAAS
jgi:hypothetical protein